MTPILVIIDMQPIFAASQTKRLLDNLCKQIKYFKSRKWPIIVVEYVYYGSSVYSPISYRTDHRIISAIGSYWNVWYTRKIRDDGGKEIADICHNVWRDINNFEFHITGIHTSACVLQTIKGLGQWLPNSVINVISDCCADWGGKCTILSSSSSIPLPPNTTIQQSRTKSQFWGSLLSRLIGTTLGVSQ